MSSNKIAKNLGFQTLYTGENSNIKKIGIFCSKHHYQGMLTFPGTTDSRFDIYEVILYRKHYVIVT
jgi:hypothetical protein